jgi:hypothetical protein
MGRGALAESPTRGFQKTKVDLKVAGTRVFETAKAANGKAEG